MLNTILQDLRYGLRMLRKSPGFTVVAVMSLALGIGANTAIFSVIDTMLLKMLPVKDPEQLVFIKRVLPSGKMSGDFLYPVFEQLRDHNQTLSGMFAIDDTRLSASVDGQAEMIAAQFVSGSYYSVLGVGTVLGRNITIDDDRPERPPVAVISYGYWQRRFSLDPATVGRKIVLKGIPFTIVGVTPPDFRGLSTIRGADITLPLVMHPQLALKDHNLFEILGRLKSGVTVQQARADLTVIYQQYLAKESGAVTSPTKQREILAQGIDFSQGSKGRLANPEFARQLQILMTMVGLVLLIACANVANLLLARASAREREIAVRLAVGAGRLRLVRQLLTESMLLACLGGITGLLLAWWGGDLLLPLVANGRPLKLNLDLRVLGFTIAVSLLTGILFGLLPAFRATRVEVNATLKGSAPMLAIGKIGLGMGKALVISQVALSLILLIGAGLFIRTLQKLNQVDVGFYRDNVLRFWAYPTLIGYEGSREIRLYQDLLERFNSLPGVRSATISRFVMSVGWSREIASSGNIPQPDEKVQVSCNPVGPKFFETMGIPLLLGREFTNADDVDGPRVAVISEAAARLYFPNESPIGKKLIFREPKNSMEVQIVGVVRDIKHNLRQMSSDSGSRVVYIPFTQAPQNVLGQIIFEVRTVGNPFDMIAALRREAQAVEKDLPLFDIQTQAEYVDQTLNKERSLAQLTSLFGLLALLLASIGLYGTMSYGVNRRTTEIGIRMALGAQPGSVKWLVMCETLLLMFAGVVIGVPAALAAARLISSLLYGLTPTDPVTISLSILLMIMVAAFAGYLPARRASRVDPMIALHCE